MAKKEEAVQQDVQQESAAVEVVQLVIEKGVPMPQPRTSRKYDFSALEVGDSFVVATDQANSIRATVSHWAKSHPDHKFATRKTDAGVRVWRTA